MKATKVRTKKEYIHLMPPVTRAEYERLKRSIKEEGGLLVPAVLNQDNVVLDGHHRLQACAELNIPARCCKKDFTGRPLDELMFVVSVNLYRRNLNDFQRAELGIHVEEILRKSGQLQQEAARFTPETSQAAHRQRYHPGEDADLPFGSPDPDRSRSRKDPTRGGVSEEMAERLGVSRATYDRVRYILSNGNDEIIKSLRRGYVEDENTKSKRGPIGIRTAYEELRYQKLQSKLGSSSDGISAHSTVEQEVPERAHDHGEELQREKGREDGGVEDVDEDEHEIVSADDMSAKIHDEKESKKEAKTTGMSSGDGRRGGGESVRLVNKDFRLVDQEDIPHNSIDLVLSLNFPDPRIPEDQDEHLMGCAYPWLKEGGLLAMHIEQSLLPRIICSRPPGFQFFRMICVLQQEKMGDETSGQIAMVTLFDTTDGWVDANRREYWRPYVVLVKGQRGTHPLVGPNILDVIYTTGDVIDLASALVLSLCPANGCICDPFMGKGIVGDATIKFGEGRKYIGRTR